MGQEILNFDANNSSKTKLTVKKKCNNRTMNSSVLPQRRVVPNPNFIQRIPMPSYDSSNFFVSSNTFINKNINENIDHLSDNDDIRSTSDLEYSIKIKQNLNCFAKKLVNGFITCQVTKIQNKITSKRVELEEEEEEEINFEISHRTKRTDSEEILKNFSLEPIRSVRASNKIQSNRKSNNPWGNLFSRYSTHENLKFKKVCNKIKTEDLHENNNNIKNFNNMRGNSDVEEGNYTDESVDESTDESTDAEDEYEDEYNRAASNYNSNQTRKNRNYNYEQYYDNDCETDDESLDSNNTELEYELNHDPGQFCTEHNFTDYQPDYPQIFDPAAFDYSINNHIDLSKLIY